MNTKHFVVISILFFLAVGTLFIVVKERDPGSGPVIPPPINNKGPVGNLLGELKSCDGKFSDAKLLEPNSRMYDVVNGTVNIKPNVIQLYGIIKNNSKDCALKSITMKVTFSSNGQVLQEQTMNLLGEVKYPAFALQPEKSTQYMKDITVFESLLTKTIGSTKLRSDVVKRELLIGAEWVMPPSNQTNN